MNKINYNILILFFILLFIILFLTIPDYGITWDEPLYYQAGDSYLDWTIGMINGLLSGEGFYWFREDIIEQYWYKNAQHPPLVKILTGITHRLFNSLFGSIIAYRLAGTLWYLLLIGIVFHISYRYQGWRAGWFSAIATATLPRLFPHGHFVDLDLPLAVLWLLCVYSYHRGRTDWRWSIATGIFFGLGLLTKITALFIIIPCLIWSKFIDKKKYSNNIFCMLFIGFGIFILFWPWLWHDIFNRFISYYEIFFTFQSPLKTYYFGSAYAITPWHYPFLMILFTTPIPIFILAIYGFIKNSFNKDKRDISLLWSFNILFLLILFALPGTLVIDGIRYFLPVVPILGIYTGIGFDKLIHKYEKYFKKEITIYIFGLILILPSLFWLIYLHPAQLSYYNILVGGPAGAQKIGMETTYWGEIFGPEEKEWINQNIPLNAKIKFLPVFPGEGPIAALSFFPDVILYYQKNGYLRKDINFFSEPPYDYFILISRQGLFDLFCWHLYRNEIPIYSVHKGNLFLLGIYAAR